ncbi:MAG: succinate dehydrogenase/fumarate reductase iron-sulfur subunit, partial [Dehalococcoidales bacterium]
MAEVKTKQVVFKLQRYNPEQDNQPHFQEFIVPSSRGMTVLDGLLYIKENQDSSLTFRASCRMGICGSCGIFINNYPYLACHTQIEGLQSARLTIKPLPNLPVIKDLIVDLTSFFSAHRLIKPYLIRHDREEMENPTAEFIQLPQELNDVLQFTNCIKCGICLSACPTSASDKLFLGPGTISQCYR